jgi:phytoene dehydrogenase-like protein
MKKSIIIIGSGIAGLSAGCYGQMNGYNTQIFEMDHKPGGVCTSWKRKGYTIDGCLHWLTGSGPGNNFYPLWQEVGVLQGRTIIDHEEYGRIEGKEGEVLIIYSNIDRLEQHLKEIAPEDKYVIKEFTDGIRKCINFPMPVDKARELYGIEDGFRMMKKMFPYSGFFRRYSKLTLKQFADGFKNQFLREIFPLIPNLQNPPDFPIMALFMTLAWMNQKVAGYPIGGSMGIARAMEKRYFDLGGKTDYKSRVEKILVENNQAVGVRLFDSSEHRSDYVISAADGHTTIFDMLDGKYINQKIKNYYDELPLFPGLVYIGLGINDPFEEIPKTVTGIDFPLQKQIMINGKERKRLSIQFYNFDPTLAPSSKTYLRVWFKSDFDYWKKLYQKPKQYKEEKKRIINEVIAALDKRFPGIAAKVEMTDMATPVTWERYTGNWKGSFEGWLISTKTLRMRMKKTLPGLKNFYMAGQWVEPGGSLPTALMSGRNVIQILCKNNNKEFVTTKP